MVNLDPGRWALEIDEFAGGAISAAGLPPRDCWRVRSSEVEWQAQRSIPRERPSLRQKKKASLQLKGSTLAKMASALVVCGRPVDSES